MKSIARGWRTFVLALPVAGALAFGGSQALASPAAAAPRGERECQRDWECWEQCPLEGGYVIVPGRPCACCFA